MECVYVVGYQEDIEYAFKSLDDALDYFESETGYRPEKEFISNYGVIVDRGRWINKIEVR